MAMVSEQQLNALARRGVTLLRIRTKQWRSICETRLGGTRFSLTFPHDVAKEARSKSLVLISVGGEEPSLHVAFVTSVQATATFDSRVAFDERWIIQPRSLNELLKSIQEPNLQRGVRNLARSNAPLQAISSKLGARIVRGLADISENHIALGRIVARLDQPRRFDNARALQQDALNLALRAFGLNEGASELFIDGDSALGRARLQEDAVISHDARRLPGWRLDQSDLTGRAIFRKDGAELEVFTANKLPLEEIFGVDLIYLNARRGSLVLVQYKMMDAQRRTARETTEWLVTIDRQFRDELSRMQRFDRDLSNGRPYRLNCGSFFFKLVRRDAAANSAGILLSKGHLDQLLADGQLRGPRGGLRISFQALDGHYLQGEAFVELVRSGYIGSRGATTMHLQTLIEAALDGGRAVVAAIETPREPSSEAAASENDLTEYDPIDEVR
jgi:hypothetical protein